ncbi:MAG TPA: cation diffusion facilitator family transporter, partial [Bryobacteraceae bacterium]|nr:cation diffusion facilitator family transporter [Bryobacteraceae bacterium]
GHSHAPAHFGTAFAVGVTLNSAFVVLEVVYGLFAHSLALVADAGHNLSDVFGLLLAWAATVWARRAATLRHTYGWRRSSILAALGNALLLLISVGVIAWQAVRRLRNPVAVESNIMIWVSAAGIAVNAITAWMFMAGRKGDLNLRAAFQHMAADAVISAGVVVAGVVIAFTGWLWLDPAVSLALVAVVVAGTWGLLRDSVDLALDAVPGGVDLAAIRQYLGGLPAVVDVHHLHAWGLSTSEAALTAHVVLGAELADNTLLATINRALRERFGIAHATIQFEIAGAADCPSKECQTANAEL